MDIYAQNILDHYKNPRNQGKIVHANAKHFETNTLCGDSIGVSAKIEKNIVQKIQFTGEGCAISQAAISLLSEHIKGKNISVILKLGSKEMQDLLGVEVTQRRMKCALLGLLSVQNAILGHQKKLFRSWADFMEE